MKRPKSMFGAPGAGFNLVPLQVLVPVLSTLIALGIGLLIIASTGGSVSEAIAAFWDGMAGSDYNIGASLNRAAVRIISIASLGVGVGATGRSGLAEGTPATKLRSNFAAPVAARRSASASSSIATICRTSSCL